MVLEEFWKVGLTANPYHLELTKAQYLGYCIGRGLLRPLERKIDVVKEYPQLTTKGQVHAFLGLVRYYSRFIPNFTSLLPNLSDMMRKGQPGQVKWNTKDEQAFQTQKTILTSSPILCNPNFHQPFIV